MKELQKFAGDFQKEMQWEIKEESYERTQLSLMNNYMLLTTEVAEIAEELREAFNKTNTKVNEGMSEIEAFKLAKESIRENMGKEIADCLAYLTKFANFFEVDMEESFYAKMNEVKNRQNRDVGIKK